MTPKEVYSYVNEGNRYHPENLVYLLQHSYHGNQIAPQLYNLDIDWTKNTMVTAHRVYYIDCRDGRRSASMSVVCYDGKPFMIVKTAGRDVERDSCVVYITDFDLYGLMNVHLITCVRETTITEWELDKKVPLDEDLDNLGYLYGQTITKDDLKRGTNLK